MNMVSQNVINPEKRGKIAGTVFHLFYPNLATSFLFDSDLTTPIIWGSKNVVMSTLKKIDKILDVPSLTKVKVYSYILSQDGYRRIDTYNGPIGLLGKYIKRY